jgi:hypothetical protein
MRLPLLFPPIDLTFPEDPKNFWLIQVNKGSSGKVANLSGSMAIQDKFSCILQNLYIINPQISIDRHLFFSHNTFECLGWAFETQSLLYYQLNNGGKMISTQRSTKFSLILLVLTAFFLASCSGTIIRPSFSHQGQLEDQFGNTVTDGSYEFVYRLFHEATGGTSVYEKTQTVEVKDGLFNNILNFGTDISPDVFTRRVYLEVEINGEILTPRQQLQGAPFAFSLVPGATVYGPATIDRTFGTYEDTGSAMTIFNTDPTMTGGHGLTVVNNATVTTDDLGRTAALNVVAAGEYESGSYLGSYGARIVSEGYRGSYTKSPEIFYAAVFDSPAGIHIITGGACVGCTVAYNAQNAGEETIQVGDFVTAVGVREDAALGVPVMLVRKAISADEAVVGIALNAQVYEPVGELYGIKTGGFDGKEGPAESDGYLSVAVQGLVKVRLGGVSAPEIGKWITISDGKIALSKTGVGVARVMGVADEADFIWIMFNGGN